jgi:hypothetical protein
MPPEEFENSRLRRPRGHRPVDMATIDGAWLRGSVRVWPWGRYGAGHAWVTFERERRTFIVEALAAHFAVTFPRLSTLRYRPRISVS